MLKHTVSFVDLRDKRQTDLLRAYPDRARALFSAACKQRSLPGRFCRLFSRPVADYMAYRWLSRNKIPYLHDVHEFSDILHRRGVTSLNAYLDWTASSGVFRANESVSLIHIFNCPVPTLGQNVMVVLQDSKAGEFYNITWPGIAGVYAAMAPGRFSVSVNKGPAYQQRAQRIRNLFNPVHMYCQNAYAPQFLLRQVLEFAPDYEAAKYMLSHVRVAFPCIFTLAGVKPGQGCVIERLEDAFQVVELSARNRICASDHFSSMLDHGGRGWQEDTSESESRLRQMSNMQCQQVRADNFDWLQTPVINPHTRFCMITDAANRRLMVQGYEGLVAATDVFNLPAPLNVSKIFSVSLADSHIQEPYETETA